METNCAVHQRRVTLFGVHVGLPNSGKLSEILQEKQK